MAFRALVKIAACCAGSSAAPLKEMVITCRPRLESSRSICSGVMSYLVRICGYWVKRNPIKPVSCITSRMSVKCEPGKEFHKFEPSAHLTLWLAGSACAARANIPASPSKASLLVIANSVPVPLEIVILSSKMVELGNIWVERYNLGLNIKNEEANRLAHELAGVTGESLTTAVTVAVRERLERLQQSKAGSLSERLLKIGKECSVHLKEPFRTVEHGDLLYDEKGLPK